MSDNIASAGLDASEITELRSKYYNATITERIDSHSDLTRFRIRPDAGFDPFEPGQYVAMGLGNWEPRLDGTQVETLPEKKLRKVVRRAYSISCPLLSNDGELAPVDKIDYLEFYVTLVREASSPDEKPPALTPRLFKLGVGDRLVVEKKITGHYTLGDVGKDDTILMLSTGTGEAPHNAMTAKLLSDGHQGRIINATSVRNRKDLAYLAVHQELMRRFSNYRYLPYTTREPENLQVSHSKYVGKQYLQDLFVSGKLSEDAGVALEPSSTHVFLCGNPSMIGYVPPGAPPLDSPGMLTRLTDAGFREGADCHSVGCVRFEKYW